MYCGRIVVFWIFLAVEKVLKSKEVSMSLLPSSHLSGLGENGSE